MNTTDGIDEEYSATAITYFRVVLPKIIPSLIPSIANIVKISPGMETMLIFKILNLF